MAKKQFKAESKRLLDLMVNSIYTHKEIFLREIISNASDAIDKLCYVSLTDDKVGMSRGDFKIEINVDKDARTITVSDNGIGMDKDDLEHNLGVIASSGSYQFRQEADPNADVDIIGQFGVGFYSAFMVAQDITVRSKKYGTEQAYCWQSSGADGYTISECEKDGVGTDVIMHLKDDTEEEKYGEYLDHYKLYSLVKKYSDYIRYPIRMVTPVQKVKEGSPEDKPEFELVEEMTTVNSMVPLWQRKRSEVSDEEYQKFYQDLVRDFDKPARIITASVEGAVTYKALLFVPGKRPLNFNTEDFEKGLQLYSAGVMIMDKCDALLPDYLRFVRGVVDSPDLSLNISRELLQHDRQLKVIAGNLEKKIRGDFEKFLKEDREGYEKFYANYGRQIGYGIVGEGGETRKDALQELLMFYSSTEKKLVTLREYVDRMRSEQKCIYYAAGESIAAIDLLPQTELLKDKNYEILYFTGEADEFVVQTLQKYADKPFRSIVDGDLELGDEEEKVDDEKPEVMKFIK
ncbi:MAG: molecular chaperone HtpG, partial [Oscillospiraceae bacterium]|nr:molecular chaperone HtpG [Oscillospiraceae bacterium]